jgi:hypothetical protein
MRKLICINAAGRRSTSLMIDRVRRLPGSIGARTSPPRRWRNLSVTTQYSTMEAIMPEQSSIHPYLNWTKERIDEMDATLASFEAQAAKANAESRVKFDQESPA